MKIVDSKVQFLVVGTAKAGTTSLYEYLLQHPDIYIPSRKECRYFSLMNGDFVGPGSEFQNDLLPDYESYLKLFEVDKVGGDISNDYLYYYKRAIPEIIKRLGNDIPIVIILRNPAKRAFSNYSHHVRAGWENCSFKDALDLEEKRKGENWAWPWYYKEVGNYYNPLKAYLNSFKNVKVYFYEDQLFSEAFFDSFFEFVGVKKIKINSSIHHNKSGKIKNRMIYDFIHSDSILAKALKSPKKLLPKKMLESVKLKINEKNLESIKAESDDLVYLNQYYKEEVDKISKLLSRDLNALWNI